MGDHCKFLERNNNGEQTFYDERMTSTEIRGRREILDAFIQSGIDLEHCNIPIGMAISQDCEEIVFMFINQVGCSVNTLYDDIPLLHWASIKGNSRLVGLMIERGVDVNVMAPKSGLTALHYATERDRMNVVEILLGAGASPSIKDLKGLTPLDVALQRNKTSAISKMLLEKIRVHDIVLIEQETSSIKLEKN